MALKSHFKFSNSQRNGILLLVAVVIGFQCVYMFVDFSSDEIQMDPAGITQLRHQIDSLKQASANEKPKVFPFNPNYITDYKGYALGMSPAEIDRLFEFRKTNQWINSVKQFQKVTLVSDSLLNEISPLFKFPDWVSEDRAKSIQNDKSNALNRKVYGEKTFDQKIDLNIATALQLQRVHGIGEKLSANIINYRNKFKGGFISEVQLQDVYGLTPEVIDKVTNDFAVKTPRVVERINLNTASRDQLVTIQHIDYEIAHYIIEQRSLRDGFKSFDELLKVKNFPAEKLEIIKLYLTLN